MSKVLKHEFYEFYEFYEQNGENHSLKGIASLMNYDGCKFCGLIIDNEKLHGNSTVSQAKINEKYPCLTEEEYLIKKLL